MAGRLRCAGPTAPTVPASRTLWISPLSFELGIARQTFLHESVHAVQSCPSGKLQPIGWSLPLQPLLRNEISGILINGYPFTNHLLEQEAFALQGQPDATARLLRAMADRCRGRGKAAAAQRGQTTVSPRK